MKVKLKSMKKIIGGLMFAALVLIVCFSISSCKSDITQVTMAEIIEANKTENLLKSYSSIHEVITNSNADYERYVEPGVIYFKDESTEEIKTSDNMYGYYEGDYYGKIQIGQIRINQDNFDAYIGIDGITSANQTITSIQKDKDILIVSAELNTEYYKKLAENNGTEYKDGDYVKSDLRIDAKTYVILETEDTLIHKDGAEEKFGSLSMTFNEPRPQGMQSLLDRIDETADMRTVTIIADPGTSDEETYSSRMLKGENAMIQTVDKTTLYTDSACSEIYQGGADKNKDLTLYIKTK